MSRLPDWNLDPPEDDIDADAAEQFAEEQFDEDLDWTTPNHAPFNEPDYQATLDRRQERSERILDQMVDNLNRKTSQQ